MLAVLYAISFSHLVNDTLQALVPSIYPLLKSSFHLNFKQLGYITFTMQCTASLLQPIVGVITDRRSLPYSLPIGMSMTMIGIATLAFAPSFHVILIAGGLIGIGSAVFHPEASRIAHMAAGKRRGLAQSIFQLGGNFGSSLGPLLAAVVVVAYGLNHLAWFSLLAFAGSMVLWRIGNWQRQNWHRIHRGAKKEEHATGHLPRRKVLITLAVLLALVFSKYIYLVSLTNYYTFYLIEKFKVSIPESQFYLFLFLFSVAAGTIIGGPIGDRIGRKRVIWASILGVAPFSMTLPYVSLTATVTLAAIIGFILASAFSAIVVYAQELVPGKIGLISGLFFGAAFGVAGIGAAELGALADRTNIEYVFHLCAYLPLIGLLAVFLPDIEHSSR